MWSTERARYLRKGTWCEPEQAHLHHASEDTATCALARSRTGPAAVPTRERPALCMLMADAILGGGGLDLYDRRLGRPTAARALRDRAPRQWRAHARARDDRAHRRRRPPPLTPTSRLLTPLTLVTATDLRSTCVYTEFDGHLAERAQVEGRGAGAGRSRGARGFVRGLHARDLAVERCDTESLRRSRLYLVILEHLRIISPTISKILENALIRSRMISWVSTPTNGLLSGLLARRGAT